MTKTATDEPLNSSFASRKAQLEADEAADIIKPRRSNLAGKVDQTSDVTLGDVTLRRVQG